MGRRHRSAGALRGFYRFLEGCSFVFMHTTTVDPNLCSETWNCPFRLQETPADFSVVTIFSVKNIYTRQSYPFMGYSLKLICPFIFAINTSVLGVCVCVCCHPIYSGRQVVCGRTSRGHKSGRSHRISPPSFCGAFLNFSREKDSAVPFPRRP